ncbi:tRNA (adenine(22)-N(1))-methyltransferase [Alicyclobacillus pomorum]|uniref:tRNA (adenine(22)-N(1))-methyltransferase n=1 Tax=Alicyclobacillus pomorum TaxID=204470 RepID=UPI00040DEBF4|nr:class I SAM-dependent methyltransferase [Alicyclobacillus pomorum]
MTITISNRLQWLADRVPEGSSVVDVGTDHAMLPIYLIQSERGKFAVATDVRPGPYNAAVSNVKRHGLEHAISVRLGDGLTTVTPGEVEVAVIAGMGGATATSILDASRAVTGALNRLHLQPMNASGSLRKYVRVAQFGIAEEAVILEDGRFYELLVVDRTVGPDEAYGPFAGHPESLELAMEFGPTLLMRRDPVTAAYFRYVADRLRGQLSQLERGRTAEADRRRSAVISRLNFLRQWQPVDEEGLR